jgi:hypothetical protein
MDILDEKKINFLDLVEDINYFLNVYEKSGKILLDLFSDLHSLKSKKENKIISALLFHEKDYYFKLQKLKIEKKIKKEIYFLTKELEYLFLNSEKYFHSLSKEKFEINKNTIHHRIRDIRNNFELILEELIIVFNFDLHSFRTKYRKIKQNIILITRNIQIIGNIYCLNTRDVIELDYSKIKKVPSSKLEVGDIILFDKGNNNHNIYRKFLRQLLNSNIIHSAIIYSIKKDRIYVLEANSFNSRIISIDRLVFEDGFNYIVMRAKKALTDKQKDIILAQSDISLNEKFNNFKIIIGSIERFREYVFRTIPFVRRKKNPLYFMPGSFCSEIVIRLYANIGINLGISEDSSMGSPVDIFKSKNLKIVGILDK